MWLNDDPLMFFDPIQDEAEDLAAARTSSSWPKAVAFLRDYLAPHAAEIRAAMKTPAWPWEYHTGWGMALRNVLRSRGFSETAFDIKNLDNVYVQLVEEAVAEPVAIDGGVEVAYLPGPFERLFGWVSRFW